MQRAAVLIGVANTGNLQPLQAVYSGVAAVEKWALSQGMDRANVKVITDKKNPVTAAAIKKAVKDIVDLATIEQLIVYFSGHGVNNSYSEYWLLSDAPDDSQAAVNVEGSVVLARQSGIPHVVMFSDACRTAAEGIQAQHVRGSEIFPNTGNGGLEQAVDLFFGCTVGRPSLEIKDPAISAQAFKAIYTGAVVDALHGNHRAICVRVENDPNSYFVRPRPLKKHLSPELARRLKRVVLPVGVTPPTPDARITSDDDAWIAQLTLPGVVPAPLMHGEPSGPPGDGPAAARLLAVSETLIRDAIAGNAGQVEGSVQAAVASADRDLLMLGEGVKRGTESFGPMHFETGCGFKIRGARIAEAFSVHVQPRTLDNDRQIVRVEGLTGPAANVLLRFDEGTGVVLPAIRDFLAAVTVEDGEVENVTYEPSDSSWRWHEMAGKLQELRTLRATVASAARLGVFRLEREDAPELARRMQYAKGVDPTMAIYAAYAYHDLNRRDRLTEMQQYLRGDLNIRFFDIAMLARSLTDNTLKPADGVFPFFPLLSQGWVLLAAHRISLPADIGELDRHLVRSSLWTLFDRQGVEIMKHAMNKEKW